MKLSKQNMQRATNTIRYEYSKTPSMLKVTLTKYAKIWAPCNHEQHLQFLQINCSPIPVLDHSVQLSSRLSPANSDLVTEDIKKWISRFRFCSEEFKTCQFVRSILNGIETLTNFESLLFNFYFIQLSDNWIVYFIRCLHERNSAADWFVQSDRLRNI